MPSAVHPRSPRAARLRTRGGRAVFAVPGRGALALRQAPGVSPVDSYAPQMAAAMRIRPGESAWDLGCGAGAYGLALAARGAARTLFSDISPAAVACALANARRNGLAGAVGRVGPLLAPARGERFDVIVATPPQLPAPRALTPHRYGGADGLRVLRRVVAGAASRLRPGGRLYLLVTDWCGPRRVAAELRRRGFRVRRAERVEQTFRPREYERLQPGLFAYLDGRARRGKGRYARRGGWCFLGVELLEAVVPG